MTDTTNIPREIGPSQPPPPPPPPAWPPTNLLPRPIGPHTSSVTPTLAKKRAQMAAQYSLADAPREPYPPLFTPTTFKPCYMFFYGTLMDPDVLQHITRCPTKPVVRPGWITGLKPKMWVSFPTLIPPEEFSSSILATEEAKLGQGREVSGEGDAQTRKSESSIKIHGMFWQVEDCQHFWALQQYETSAYRGHWCQIHVEDNSEVLEGSVVFVWAKKPQKPDLADGVFDLTKW